MSYLRELSLGRSARFQTATCDHSKRGWIGEACVTRREISPGENRFARNGGAEETLAKRTAMRLLIRGFQCRERGIPRVDAAEER